MAYGVQHDLTSCFSLDPVSSLATLYNFAVITLCFLMFLEPANLFLIRPVAASLRHDPQRFSSHGIHVLRQPPPILDGLHLGNNQILRRWRCVITELGHVRRVASTLHHFGLFVLEDASQALCNEDIQAAHGEDHVYRLRSPANNQHVVSKPFWNWVLSHCLAFRDYSLILSTANS